MKNSILHKRSLQEIKNNIISDIKSLVQIILSEKSESTEVELARRINVTTYNENKTISSIDLIGVIFGIPSRETIQFEDFDEQELLNILEVVEDTV